MVISKLTFQNKPWMVESFLFIVCVTLCIQGCHCDREPENIEARINMLSTEGPHNIAGGEFDNLVERQDENSDEIIKIGKPAIPYLIAQLHNQKQINCEFGYGKFSGDAPAPSGGVQHWVIRVSDKADWILKQITGKDLGFDSDASEEQRAAAIAKWKKWWEGEKEK